MALKLKNRWRYQGNDRWEWEAFIDDENTGELDKVDLVEYVLHPTFSDPIRRTTDRRNAFALRTAGWGTFELKAFAHLKDGSRKKLTHELKLEYEPAEGTSG